jgi:hypothetical protein
MIAGIALAHGARLTKRKLTDFSGLQIDIANPSA